MKKLVFAMAVIASVAFAACSGNSNKSTETTATEETTAPAAVEEAAPAAESTEATAEEGTEAAAEETAAPAVDNIGNYKEELESLLTLKFRLSNSQTISF